MTRAVSASTTAFSSPPIPTNPLPFSTNQLMDAVRATHVLTPLEQKLYMRMIHCAGDFGIDNDFEIFQAAGYCFDLNFGKDRTHNIITVADFLSVMGEKAKGTLGENDAISPDFFTRGRPGFFLLTPERTVYFMKEACDGSMVYYNPLLNAFVDGAQIPVTGKEKLVVLNKSSHPELETYCGAPTPDQPIEGKFYHEKQDGRKCGIHALHAFLGFPIVDETLLSLLKLEMTTDATYTSYLRRGIDRSLLPRGQIDHYKNIARFRLAQTSLFQADLGNNADHLAKLLQLLVRQGKVEPKYLPCRTYGIFLSRLETEYAINKGLYVGDQEWNEAFVQKLLIAVDEDLASHHTEMEQIDRRLKEIQRDEERCSPPARFASPETIDLIQRRKPFDILENVKRNLEKSLQGMRELANEFEKNDRLLIASDTEDHCFSLRKCENGDWAVIDSLKPEQILVQDPLKWLNERMRSFYRATGRTSYDFITLSK